MAKLGTRVFELAGSKFKTLEKLAEAMKLSPTLVTRVRDGRVQISQHFIIGAKRAFPELGLDQLFYFIPDKSPDSKEDEVVKLRKGGMTYADIGRRLGITRERVRQIWNRSQEEKKPAFEALITTADVACILKVHVNTVRRWTRKGILPAYLISNRGDRRFHREEVMAVLKERKTGRKSREDG